MGAAEDMGLKEWVEQMGQKMPTTLDKAKEGLTLLKAAGEAHPLVKYAIIQGLTMLGVGKLAEMLGWIGKAVE